MFEGEAGLAALAEPATRPEVGSAPRRAVPAASLKLIITAPDAGERERLKKLFSQQDPGNRITVDLPLVRGFAVEVSPTAVQVLPEPGKMSHHVRAILDSETGIPEGADLVEGARRPVARLDTATPTVGLGELWARGVEGNGVTIAVIDTGIAPHPDLSPAQVKDVLMQSPQSLPDMKDPNWQGKGAIDAAVAYDVAVALPKPGPEPPPSHSPVPPPF